MKWRRPESVKISSDRGRSWGPTFTIQENVGAENVMEGNLLRLQSGEIWTKTFTLSKSETIITYDAAYLGLAVLNDARFVTADRELHDKLSDGLKQYVLLLSTMK